MISPHHKHAVLTASASASSAVSSSDGVASGTVTVTFVIIGLLIILVIAAFFLLPGIIATATKRPDALAIWLVNVLLGWTIGGWIIALIWSLKPIGYYRPGVINVSMNNINDRGVISAHQATEEIKSLQIMKDNGTITDDQFNDKKSKILAKIG